VAQAFITRRDFDHTRNAIFHVAAESHVDRSISGPDAFVTAIVVGTHELQRVARQV